MSKQTVEAAECWDYWEPWDYTQTLYLIADEYALELEKGYANARSDCQRAAKAIITGVLFNETERGDLNG